MGIKKIILVPSCWKRGYKKYYYLKQKQTPKVYQTFGVFIIPGTILKLNLIADIRHYDGFLFLFYLVGNVIISVAVKFPLHPPDFLLPLQWIKIYYHEISISAMFIPTENDILWIFHVTNKLKN